MYISTTHTHTHTHTHTKYPDSDSYTHLFIWISNRHLKLNLSKAEFFLILPIYSPSVPSRSIWLSFSTQLLRTKTLVLSLTPFSFWQYPPYLSSQTTSYYPFLLRIRSTFIIHLKPDHFAPLLLSFLSTPPSLLIQTAIITSQFPASNLAPSSQFFTEGLPTAPNPPITSLPPKTPSFITVPQGTPWLGPCGLSSLQS